MVNARREEVIAILRRDMQPHFTICRKPAITRKPAAAKAA
jgi:hypothetical protein